jgi:hypothetical protein
MRWVGNVGERRGAYRVLVGKPERNNRPAVLHNLPPHLILKHHIHTVSVSNFLSNILHSLLE